MSDNIVFLSSGCSILPILVQYNLFLFCAETSAELISTGSTPTKLVITSLNSFFILTFSSRNFVLGFLLLTWFKISTKVKNNLDLGSSNANCFPAKLKPWQGLPASIRSIEGQSISHECHCVMSPNLIMLG